MKKIKYIVVHCLATKEGHNITAKDVHKMHLQRGFAGIGYNYVVLLDGTIEKGRPEYWQGAHVLGHNDESIGIAYVGGVDKDLKAKDTRTDDQKASLWCKLEELKTKYPSAEILGHRDFSKDLNKNGTIEPFEYMKQCPCFDAKEEYKDIKANYDVEF